MYFRYELYFRFDDIIFLSNEDKTAIIRRSLSIKLLLVGTMQWFLVYIWLSLIIINICECTRSKRVKRIVGGINALPPPPDAAVIFTRLYGRNSRIEGIR